MCEPSCPAPCLEPSGFVRPALATMLCLGVLAAFVVVDVGATLKALAGSVALLGLTLWAADRLAGRLWGREPQRRPLPSARPLLIAVRAWVDAQPGVWPSDSIRRRLPAASRALPAARPALEPSRVWTGAEWQRAQRATLGGEPDRGPTPP